MLKRQIVIIVINFNRRNLQNPIEVVIIIIGLAPPTHRSGGKNPT